MVTHHPAAGIEPAADTAAKPFPRSYIGAHEVTWLFADGGHVRSPEFSCIAGPGADCRPAGCEHPECCEAISWLEIADVAYGGTRERPYFDGEITIDIPGPGRATWVHSEDWVCQDCYAPVSLSDALRCVSCWIRTVFGALHNGERPSSGARP